ncbi:hypothetical protein B9T33_07490 [Acinetobacter sp. ANC 5054]|uniref:YfiR family protein n=1 Tax=Acinetobacter sp. ANC 5054 TaxID=1977877 RepID=UPI000A33AFEB|nr:YfiR family protein [Acinetobacter sp. ANC 5054]OTG80987.1 hypothetical protein B9T33_07490 [Acinetobacter sp. ANC 5054]
MAYLKKIAWIIGGLALTPVIYANPASNIFSTTFSILSYAKWETDTPKFCIVNNANSVKDFKKYAPAHSNYIISSIQVANIKSNHCQILFFSNLSAKEEQNILNSHVSFPALSISSNNSECENGSAFCLYRKKQNFAFKINMESLTQSQVHIDPRVLLLAKASESAE